LLKNPRPKESILEYTTSVVGLLLSPGVREPTKLTPGHPLRPESPLSCDTWHLARHFDYCVARSCPRSKSGTSGRSLLGGYAASSTPRRRGALQRMKCDWHLCFVLILRGRHLSARNPEPASPVEASHPHCFNIIQ
jgi:hypothetical protein